MRNIKIVDVGTQYNMDTHQVFDDWNPVVVNPKGLNEFVLALDNADLVLLGGGADVHPAMYKHNDVASHCGVAPSMRDLLEEQVWKHCQQKGIPILGICRGAQFATAMAGGFLIQNVDRHAGADHLITMKDGRQVSMSSYHHQMMMPQFTEHELLGWTDHIARVLDVDYMNVPKNISWDKFQEKEPEIVLFPKHNCLAIQGHPEFMDNDCDAVKLSQELTKKYLLHDNEELIYGA